MRSESQAVVIFGTDWHLHATDSGDYEMVLMKRAGVGLHTSETH